MTHIDKGTPPEAVSRAKALEQAVLSDQDMDVDTFDNANTKDQIKEIPKAVEVKPNLQKVTLEHALYKLSFGALDISVSDHQIAIRLPKTLHFSFEPTVNSNYKVSFLGESYTVVYLGGVFNFPNDNTWAITFLMDRSADD